MKKIIFIIFIIFIFTSDVKAKRNEVNLKTCIDGDTAIFIYKKEKIKVRFLAIDTPETKYSEKGEQPYGQEASDFTCNKLKSAEKIEIEYDNNSDKKDKYDRHLVWVWIDNKLLQKEIIKNGLGKVTYLYDNYKYVNELIKEEKLAKEKKIGIWSNTSNSNNSNNSNNKDKNYNIIIEGIIIIIIMFVLIIKKKH